VPEPTAYGVVQVVDPHEMVALLAQPQTKGQHWYLECRRPDPTMMKDLQHRLMGPPIETVDVNGTQPVPIRIAFQQVE
jgi:hypothetical protein